MLNRRRIKEGQTLEQLVLLSFSVLESVLLLKDNDVSQKVDIFKFSFANTSHLRQFHRWSTRSSKEKSARITAT
jgi:hypothetical protein